MNGSKEALKLQFFKDVIHDYWDVLPQEMQKDINEWYEQTKEDQKESDNITLVMSRSAFVSNNRDHMDVEQSLVDQGYVDLTEVAENFNYLTDSDIVNWDQIKHTIDKDCIDPCGVGDGEMSVDDGFGGCEVAFDWSKYKIKWED